MSRWVRAALACATLAMACDAGPRPREAFDAAPLRSFEGERGLRIEVLAEGSGAEAAAGDTLKAHYVLLDPSGEVVDTSHGKKPLIWVLGDGSAVVEGFNLGLEGARAGELRRLHVPPPLGYRGRAVGSIPGDADLDFLIEVMSVTKAK